MERIYKSDIKIKQIDTDALTHLTHPDAKSPILDTLDNNNKINLIQDKENSENTLSSPQSASNESVNQPSKVKCPYCDYEEDRFFLKIHVKNEHEGGL